MFQKSFASVLFLFILNVAAFSQTDLQNAVPQPARLIDRLSPDYSALSTLFLPEEKDAWTITITRSGGLLGQKPKFVGLLNSRGHFVCGDKVKMLDAEPLKEISDLMLGSNFKTLKKAVKSNSVFCSDCYITNFTIKYQRKKNKTATYDFYWLAAPDSAPELQQIFGKMQNSAVCG